MAELFETPAFEEGGGLNGARAMHAQWIAEVHELRYRNDLGPRCFIQFYHGLA